MMEIKIVFLAGLFVSILKSVDCAALIRQTTESRFKRSTFNASTASNSSNSNLNVSKTVDANEQVHFTTPRISTDKWIPLLNSVNSSFVFGKFDLKADEPQQFVNFDNRVQSDKFNENDKIERRADPAGDRGLIRVEKVDPIQTSASDQLFTKNYNEYRPNESQTKKEPQVQYELDALVSLNELEKRLRDQLELLENQKKIFNQQTAYTTSPPPPPPAKHPVVHYENYQQSYPSSENGFRSLVGQDNATTPNYYYSPASKQQVSDYSTEFNQQNGIRLNADHQDVFAKIDFSSKASQANPFDDQTLIEDLNKFTANQPTIVRPVKPAEVLYQEKGGGELNSANSSPVERQFGHKLNSSFQEHFLTYQPPIPTFVTSKPFDEYASNHLQSPALSNQQFRHFQNNQLQPYLYKPLSKNILATPLSYTPSASPLNSLNRLSPISYQVKPTDFPSNGNDFNKATFYSTTSSDVAPPLSPPTPTIASTFLAESIQNKTLRIQNEPFRSSLYNVPTLNTKLVESNGLSALNPQYVQNDKRNVAYIDRSPTKEYDLKSESNPNQIQYLNEGDKNGNYVLLSPQPPPQTVPSPTPITYRNNQFNPTISPTILHTPSTPNELNSKLTDSSPMHMIDMNKSPSISSTGDYVKVYDEKTNEMYYIKTNDFNNLKLTHPKLDLLDTNRPNKDYYESTSSEATRELLRAVEAVKLAVIKVKPFKSMATRAVSDLASKLKDHIRSFAGSYSSFPYTDLSEFTYDMKRDPVYLQHFDEYTGKVLSGSPDKDPFNQLKNGYAKPDFDNDNDHIIEPISLNSDRDTVKQNLTSFGTFGNSSIGFLHSMNGISRQMTGKPTNNQTASFISNKQKLDYFNRLIDEQKRSNQKKQQQQSTQRQQFTPLPTPIAIQSTQQFASAPNTSSTNTYTKPGQTRYITKIAIKPNKPPIVQHFKYIQSSNYKPISLSEQPVQTMNYRQIINHHHDLPMSLPMNHPEYHQNHNHNHNQLNHPPSVMSLNESPSMNYPMGMPRNFYQMNHPINQHPINQHPINHMNSPMVPDTYDSHFNRQPINYRSSSFTDQPMIVQESKQFATYTTQPSENLTDYSLFPKTDFLRLTASNRTNASKHDTLDLLDVSRNVSKTGNLRPIKLTKPTNLGKNNVTNKIRLPEFNFEYNPRFSPVSPSDGLESKGQTKRKNRNTLKNKKNMIADGDYLPGGLGDQYASLDQFLNQNLFNQLFNGNNEPRSNGSLLSFEPITTFAPIPFTPIAPTPESNWIFQAVDQLIDIPAATNQLSNSHPTIKYTPESQLITIASLPILHHSTIQDHLQTTDLQNSLQNNLQNSLQNALPFDYSTIKSPNRLFVTSSENNEHQNQVKQINNKHSVTRSQSTNNANSKLDNKSSTVQQPPTFEFLNPIKNRLQKLYRSLVDGQPPKRVTVNLLNGQEKSTKNSDDYEPVYKVVEFNERNLREILNDDEDAGLLAQLLAEEKIERRHEYGDLNGFKKRTLNADTSTMDTSTDEGDRKRDEGAKMRKLIIFEELLRRFYENGNNLLNLSDLNNQTESSFDTYGSITNDPIDLSTGQSSQTHSIDELTDSSSNQQLTVSNLTSYRQLIDHFNREHNIRPDERENRFIISNERDSGASKSNDVNLNKNESNGQSVKLHLLARLFNRTGDQLTQPEENAVKERTQIEVYERGRFAVSIGEMK